MQEITSVLQWYDNLGVDSIIDDTPNNRLKPKIKVQAMAASKATSPNITPDTTKDLGTSPLSPSGFISQSRSLADHCNTLEELRNAILEFDGCAIKKTANKTVFSDGNPEADIMLIGEAPGASEDMEGIPFCGQSGKLLDRMFYRIGYDRTSLYISNSVFWRPPGNRRPTPEEIAMCQPFVEKHIALVNPKLLVLVGGTAIDSLLESKIAVSRLRGSFQEYTNRYLDKPINLTVLYHPAYLLRQPTQKRLVWQDLLQIKQFIKQ